jgi:beta-glucosidase
VITVPAKSADNSVVHTEKKDDAIQQLIRCPYYTVYRIDVEHRVETWQDKPFVLMSVVEGEGTLNGTHLKKGDHLILPDGYGKVELQGRMQIIASTI